MKPAPWSMGAESSPTIVGLAVSMSAFRIWTADAAGTASRSSAAAPATVGEENEVPETRDNPPLAPWVKLANPFATTSGSIRPSAVGPRELKNAVCV